eukprot:scaffold32300_cov69-Phaeocystis_antarctica.AAC.2
MISERPSVATHRIRDHWAIIGPYSGRAPAASPSSGAVVVSASTGLLLMRRSAACSRGVSGMCMLGVLLGACPEYGLSTTRPEHR